MRKCFTAGFRDLQGGKLARRNFDQTETQQFPPNRLPGTSLQVAPDPIGRKLVVTALANRFRLAAGKDFNDVVQTEGEPASL